MITSLPFTGAYNSLEEGSTNLYEYILSMINIVLEFCFGVIDPTDLFKYD